MILAPAIFSFLITLGVGYQLLSHGLLDRFLPQKIKLIPWSEDKSPALSQKEAPVISSAFDFETTSVNLLKSSSFEAGEGGTETGNNELGQPKHWGYISMGHKENIYVSRESIRSGALGLKIEDRALTPGARMNLGINQASVTTRNGANYNLSIYVRTKDLVGQPKLRIGFMGPASTADPNYQGSGWTDYSADKYKDLPLAGVSDWTRVSFVYSNAALGKYPFFEIIDYQGGVVYLDDAQLTEGKTAVVFHQQGTVLGDGGLIADPAGNIYPYFSGQGDLGGQNNRFATLYINNADISDDLTVEDLTVSDNLAVGGTASFSNQVILADTLSVSSLNSDLLPSVDNTYSIGSTSLEWKDLYIDGTAFIDTLQVDVASSLTGNLTLTGHLLPGTDSTYNLGSNSNQWAGLFVDSVTAGSIRIVNNNIIMPDDSWIGLGSDKGRVVFDDQTQDEINILGAWVGIGSNTPLALLHIGSGGTPGSIDGANDLYVYDDLEVDGTIYGNVSGTIISGFSQGSVVFADASGNLTEDSANFYWDDTNNRLGIGTTAPGAALDIDFDSGMYLGADSDLHLTVSGSDIGFENVTNKGDISFKIHNQDGTFASKVDYSVGDIADQPRAVAVADLDNDGYRDIVTANAGDSDVSVLINDGDGTFASKVDYSSGGYPNAVAVADVDNDNYPDIVTANYADDTVSVLINNGDGTFASKVDYSAGNNPYAVAIDDLDNDGYADIAVGHYWPNNTVSVLINNGDGTFGTAIDYATAMWPYGVAIADVDNDSYQDIITANYAAHSASVLINNGDGTFASKVDYSGGYNPISIDVGDLDNDGSVDILLSSGTDNRVSVMINNGDGSFGTATDYATTADAYSAAIADLDNDGYADIAAVNTGSVNSVSVFLNNGDGTFASKADYSTGTTPFSVAVDDLDNNSYSDLVIANMIDNSVSVLLNNSGTATDLAFLDGTNARVGIGTTSPGEKLEVAGNVLIPDSYKLLLGTGKDGEIYSSSDDLYLANVTQDEDIYFQVNDGGSTTTPLAIDGSASRVGVGTTAPEATLHVAGDLKIDGGFDFASSNTPTATGTLTNSTHLDSIVEVYAVGNLVYYISAGATDYFGVIDVTDKTNPTLISYLSHPDLNMPAHLHVNGKYAYVTAYGSDKLVVIDISNPKNPFVVTSITSSPEFDCIRNVYMNGHYLYTAGSCGGDSVNIIDVSDPYNPVFKGTVRDSRLDSTKISYTDGKYVYTTSVWAKTLVIVDVSHPESPFVVGSLYHDNFYDSQKVAKYGKYLYVIGSDSPEGITIIDVSDPTAPSYVGFLASTCDWDGRVYADRLYCTAYHDQYFATYDLADPTSPSLLSVYTGGSYTHHFDISGTYAYIASSNDDSLIILDLGGVKSPTGTFGNLAVGSANLSQGLVVGGLTTLTQGLSVGQPGLMSEGPFSMESEWIFSDPALDLNLRDSLITSDLFQIEAAPDRADYVYYYNGSTYTDNTAEANSSGGTPFTLMDDSDDYSYFGNSITFSSLNFDVATSGPPLTDVVRDPGGTSSSRVIIDTTEANRVGGTAFTLLSDTNDYLYFGATSQFTELYIDVATAGTGMTTDWEYWNGSAWTSLTITTDETGPDNDGTNSFESDGKIAWSAPGDWATKQVDIGDYGPNIRNYWIRVSASAISTAPTAYYASAQLPLQWQYYNGSSWANLTPTYDDSRGLSQDGRIRWPIPSSWTTTTVNSQSAYWARVGLAFDNDGSTMDPATNLTANIATISFITGNLVNWKVGGSSVFSVDANGNVTLADDKWIGIGSSGERIAFDSNGNDIEIMGADVGIGTTSPNEKLEVAGNVRITGLAASQDVQTDANKTLVSVASDIRLKKDLEVIGDKIDVLSALESLHGYFYHWDTSQDKAANLGDQLEIGLIAQEVESVIPGLVTTGEDGYKYLRYSRLPAFLIEVAKEQQNQLTDLSFQLDKNGALITEIQTGLTNYGLGQTTQDDKELVSLEARLDTLEQNQQDQEGTASALLAEIEKTSNQIASLNNQVAFLQTQMDLFAWDSTASAVLGEATSSAALRQTEDGLSLDQSLVLYQDLNVLGKTTLADLGVTGNLQAGLISINGLEGAISAVGSVLKLQTLPGSGSLDVFNGQIIISPEGDIEIKGTVSADRVEAKEFSIKGNGSAGTAVISKGETAVTIETKSLNENSLIFITPFKIPVAVAVERTSENQFEVRINEPQEEELKFSWWIIDQK